MSVYYVDLTISGTGGTGSSNNPYGITSLVGPSLSASDTYNVRGVGSISATLNPNGATIQAWNVSLYGPWQLSCTTLTLYGIFIEGILNVTNIGSIPAFYSTKVLELDSTFFNCISTAQIWIGGGQSVTFNLKGSYFYWQSPTLSFGGGPPVPGNFIFNSIDSIYLSSSTIGGGCGCCCSSNIQLSASFVNTVTNRTTSSVIYSSSFSYTNSQFSWSPVTMPSWNDNNKAHWATSILSVGINTPPEPGNHPYTGYTTGLWGETRTGIGAMYFVTAALVLSYFSTSSVNDNSVAVSYVNLTNIVTIIQSMGTNTYFDSISKIRRVDVMYHHQNGRQKKTVVHLNANFLGLVSWSSFAQDGTWQKYAIKVYDEDGASMIIPYSVIGTGEDLTHTSGVMSLNSSPS